MPPILRLTHCNWACVLSLATLSAISIIYTLTVLHSHLQSSSIGKNAQSALYHDGPYAKRSHIGREYETRMEGSSRQYTRLRDDTVSDLLWLTLTYDKTSWGHNSDGPERTIHDLIVLIKSQRDVETTSLGLLTSSLDEYEAYKSATKSYNFARVNILMHPGFLSGPTANRDHRHDDNVQTVRRAEISKLRNYLMLKTLHAERHILWVDADVYHLDQGITNRIIAHINASEDIGIITARCSLGGMDNYDLNAWRGTRQGPRGWDLTDEEIENGELEHQRQYHVSELIEGTNDDDLVPLDTVGATLLYLRASLIWQGLSFPHQYVVGTRWGKDGWDGIESEGLCYKAKGLTGGKCMVMGGKWHVEHTTD